MEYQEEMARHIEELETALAAAEARVAVLEQERAAAPKLLEALEAGVAYAKEHPPHLYDDAGWAQRETFLDAARAAMQAAGKE